jgi:orotate phosphoribosyltransferase
MFIQSDYLQVLFDPATFKKRLFEAKKLLKNVEFDTMVITGNSGTIFGGALSVILKKPIVLVRKDKSEESTHSYMTVEGTVDIGKYIVVDDFFCTGATLNRIFSKLKYFNNISFQGCYSYMGVHGESSKHGKYFSLIELQKIKLNYGCLRYADL